MTDSGAGGIGPADLQKLAQQLHQAALDRWEYSLTVQPVSVQPKL